MKRGVVMLLLLTTASCRSEWDQDDATAFKKACIDDAITWAGSQDNAITYCNCIIRKIKEKYPDENEAMKHIETLATDKELTACRDSLKIIKR